MNFQVISLKNKMLMGGVILYNKKKKGGDDFSTTLTSFVTTNKRHHGRYVEIFVAPPRICLLGRRPQSSVF